MLARHSDGSTRLFIVGLGVHVLAIGILFGNILASSSGAEAPPPETPAPAAAPEARETARAVEELVPAQTGDARVALTPESPDDPEPAR
jgi:hypothetical protein